MTMVHVRERKFWQRMLLAGCLAAGFMALPARGEDPKPADKPAAEKPADPPPPPARGQGVGRVDPAALLKAARDRLDQLGLTDDQKKTIDAAYAAATEEIKKTADATPQERRQALQKAMTDVREKVTGVLTEDQKTKFAQMRQNLTRAVTGPVERLQAELDKLTLTAAQKEKLKPIVEDAKTKFAELRTQIQGADRAAIREKFKTFMDETRDKLNDILTPEQAEALKAALEAGRPTPPPGAPTDAPAKPATEKPVAK